MLALYQDYCVLGSDSLFLRYQYFTEIRCLHNRDKNLSTRIKIHGVLCQKLLIFKQLWQPQTHSCFNTHLTFRRPHISLRSFMKTERNKWRQVIASLWRLQRKQEFITACFRTAWFPHKFLRLLSYSTFRYATEYCNSSVPAHYLQTWDITSNADILFIVIFQSILIQYNRREKHRVHGPHRSVWVRGAALTTFTNSDYLNNTIVCKFKLTFWPWKWTFK